MVELGICEEVSGVVVTVDRAVTISGFVVKKGHEAEGIEGVTVGAFSLTAKEGAVAQRPSGPDGYFEILGVRPASYMMFAVGEAVVPEIGKSVLVKDQDVTDVLLVMDRGATLSGRVSPPAAAELTLEIDEKDIGLGNFMDMIKAAFVHAESDERGEFSMKNVPSGKFALVARARDGRTGRLEVRIVGSDDQSGLVVPLEPRASVAGRVVDAAGRPVAGVQVQVNAAKGMNLRLGSLMGGGVLTGADGAFRATGLEPGKYKVEVHDDQGRLAWADAAHRDKPDEPIEVEVKGAEPVTGLLLTVETRDGVIKGIVLGPDGSPAPDAWVTATLIPRPAPAADHKGGDTDKTKKEEHRVTVRVGTGGSSVEDSAGDAGEEVRGWGGVGPQPPVLTGPDGRFVIEHLRPGTYQVVAEGQRGTARARKSRARP